MSDGGGGSKTPATKTPTSTAGIPDINNSGFNTDPLLTPIFVVRIMERPTLLARVT